MLWELRCNTIHAAIYLQAKNSNSQTSEYNLETNLPHPPELSELSLLSSLERDLDSRFKTTGHEAVTCIVSSTTGVWERDWFLPGLGRPPSPPPSNSLHCSFLFRSITNNMQACSMWQTSPVLEDLPHLPSPKSLLCITGYHMQTYTSCGGFPTDTCGGTSTSNEYS